MAGRNMAALTASLERSLQKLSLHPRPPPRQSSSSSSAAGHGSPASDSAGASVSSDAALELNSHLSLPYYWEQCLDLKTGEVYYINWRTGMKSKVHPATTNELGGQVYSEEEEEEEEDHRCYGSEESWCEEEGSSCYSPSGEKGGEHGHPREERGNGGVLVVAGCKSCFMYFMVPKQEEDCPKCCGRLLHFDSSDDTHGVSPP